MLWGLGSSAHFVVQGLDLAARVIRIAHFPWRFPNDIYELWMEKDLGKSLLCPLEEINRYFHKSNGHIHFEMTETRTREYRTSFFSSLLDLPEYVYLSYCCSFVLLPNTTTGLHQTVFLSNCLAILIENRLF